MALPGIMGGIGLASNIAGIFGASSAAAKAAAARRQAIEDYGLQQAQYQKASQDYLRSNLYGMTGTLNDQLLAGGRGLADALAGSGVYNSSGVGGALANQGAANAQALANANVQGGYNLANIANQGAYNLANMQIGSANTDYYNAQDQLAGARAGLGQGLQALGQYQLGQRSPLQQTRSMAGYNTQGNLYGMGVPNSRVMGPAMNGNQNYTPTQVPQVSNFGAYRYMMNNPVRFPSFGPSF